MLRAIETTISTDGHIKPREGWTNKFIFPALRLHLARCADHQLPPASLTLLMVTAAFGGYERIMDVYQIAIKEKYEFGAYGDAMLII